MNGNNSQWSDDRIAYFVREWASGTNARVIAERLNASFGSTFTRNAIIGKVARMGLTRKKAADPQTVKAIKAPVVKRSHVQPPKPGPQKKLPVVFGNIAPKLELVPVVETTGVESPNARPWMERRAGQCSWPLGERHSVLSCCNPIARGLFCEGHAQAGYMVTQPTHSLARKASLFTRSDNVIRPKMPKTPKPVSVWDDARVA